MRSLHHSTSILAISTALAISASAYAQQPTENVGPGLLEEIVVTTQQRVERLIDVPVTINAISGTDLARSGATSVNDLNTAVSGFTPSGQGNITIPAIRGVSAHTSSGYSENENSLYVDGVYQAAQVVVANDLPDLDRLEVIKGPQGTLFGRNATGGAIKIFTKAPSFTPTASVSFDSGLFPGAGLSRSSLHEKFNGFVSGPISEDKVAASLSASYNWVQGYITNDQTGKRTAENRFWSTRAKLLFTPSDNFKVTATGFFNRAQNPTGVAFVAVNGLTAASQYPGALWSTQPWHTVYDPGFIHGVAKNYGGSVNASLDFSLGTLSSLTAYTRTANNNGVDVDAAYCPPTAIAAGVCVSYTMITATDEVQQELNFLSRDFGPFSFVAGLFYYSAFTDNNGTVNGGIPANLSYIDKHSYAAYAEAYYKITDNLKAIAGIRYTHEIVDLTNRNVATAIVRSRDPFKGTTPRFSLQYSFSSDMNIYATYSEGFRAGLGGALNNGNFLPGTKNHAFEVGAKYASSSVYANVSVFHYNYNRLQIPVFTGTRTVFQSADAKFTGVDFDFAFSINEEWKIRANAEWLPTAKYLNYATAAGYIPVRNPNGTFQRTTFSANNRRVIRAPETSASVTLSYDHAVDSGAVDAAVTVYYSGKFLEEITGIIEQKAYANLNAQIGYRPADSNFRFGIYGKNLTNNAVYGGAITGTNAFEATYAPPLEVGINAKYAF